MVVLWDTVLKSQLMRVVLYTETRGIMQSMMSTRGGELKSSCSFTGLIEIRGNLNNCHGPLSREMTSNKILHIPIIRRLLLTQRKDGLSLMNP